MNIIKRSFKYRDYSLVYWLIGINILIFAAPMLFGDRLHYLLLERMAMIPLMVIYKKWFWTFVTYMFIHEGFSHILFNMLGLLIFGTQVEKQMGSFEFLLYYLVTGTLAGIFSFAVYYFTHSYFITLIGASGALFAVELAYAVFFPNSVLYLWGILPIRAPVMVLGFTALELIFAFTARNSNIAHLTHLAGFGVGWVYFLVRFGVNPWRRLTGH